MTITPDRLRDLLCYEPDSGRFTWRKSVSSRAKAGTEAGCLCKHHGYRFIRLDDVLYRAHRLAWLYMHGEWPPHDIDHINGNRSDNRWGNLRSVTRAQNLQNLRQAKSFGSSGLLGAHRWRGKWRGRIQVGGRGYHLGTYDTAEEAHRAYLAAKKHLHAFQTIA